MDNERFRAAYARLQGLDEGMTYKLRGRNRSAARMTVEQLEDRLQDTASYTLELKEILQELFLAIGSKPQQRPPSA